MDIETARVFAEAFQGVGDGATSAFVVWVVFDFLKEAMYPAAWITFFLWAHKPVLKGIKEFWRMS